MNSWNDNLYFDDELNEKVITNDHDIQYISLSGGEQRKVNLAVTMALKDLLLLTDKDQPYILFLDEIAENLDEEGIIFNAQCIAQQRFEDLCQ